MDIGTANHLLHPKKINLHDQYPLKCNDNVINYDFDKQESRYKVLSFEEDNKASEKPDPNAHLRRSDKIIGYSIMAVDGKIGDVEDFIIDDGNWNLDFMVVHAGNLCHGKKVIISQKWIKETNWNTSSVIVNASVEDVKNSHVYDSSQLMSDVYSTVLHDYDGIFAL